MTYNARQVANTSRTFHRLVVILERLEQTKHIDERHKLAKEFDICLINYRGFVPKYVQGVLDKEYNLENRIKKFEEYIV